MLSLQDLSRPGRFPTPIDKGLAINPIEVVDQVIDEYRNYLLTEFRARDSKLRKALEAALTQPLFLAQEPFFQTHRPFKDGLPWRELGLDAKLAATMEARSGSKTAYQHQSDAITHLLAPDAGPLVVTTGTGSGKTECFLLPTLQNAIEDSVRFNRSGITAIVVYPMNALANDQEKRIEDYLKGAGRGDIRVARYDRQTKEKEREALRKNPPHILLTNYVMLEYLLVRPADREALFANHRCRYVVLDEVHTYRGSLGANIALLFRRLRAHLAEAKQDYAADQAGDAKRFPKLVTVATSATIKSAVEGEQSPEEQRKLRDAAVSEFLSKLTGLDRATFRVVAEEMKSLPVPVGAAWPDQRMVQWTLADLLAKKPLAISQLVEWITTNVEVRKGADRTSVAHEVAEALQRGSGLADGADGAIRLRAHRFLRGGWKFHRCVDPDHGKLFAMGEAKCECGRAAAPLLICRSCGADALHLAGQSDPEAAPLRPRGEEGAGADEWILYDRSRLTLTGEDVTEMKERPVYAGSFDPETLEFSTIENLYPQRVMLAPARNRCLACDGSAGAGAILTPVALGTSAAVRVVAEGVAEGLADQHRRAKPPWHDGKERLLIFADSRQDAAHQARFITYAGRYDRMRRRVVRLLEKEGPALSIADLVQKLLARAAEQRDNPKLDRAADLAYLPEAVQRRARAWEEAPLLDDISVSAGYRATLLNLGLVGIRYEKLDELVAAKGGSLAKSLGVTTSQLAHVARCLLDEMRVQGALSRPMLTYHPLNPNCPEDVREAEWERRLAKPRGYPFTGGEPAASTEASSVPEGVSVNNAWRKPGRGGRAPKFEWMFEHLLERMGGKRPEVSDLLALLELLTPTLISPVKLFGFKKTIELLQVNAECVNLTLLRPGDRRRCSVCNVRMPWVTAGWPCHTCDGCLVTWPAEEVDANRYVQRIRKADVLPLVAGEHTAQVTGEERIQLEEDFKAPPEKSPLNVLSCSPTLEMGIDVGGLDAVVMRNVPPRPDNYAQRGGRAGRRSRVGIVLAYARNTPHDQYFFDRPTEMIAGEVAAPPVNLGNRDVAIRHLNAIAIGAAEPGLKGRMAEYLTMQGELVEEEIGALVAGFEGQFGHAADLALRAWGPEILTTAGLDSREKLLAALADQPARVRNLFDRVRRQIIELQTTIEQFAQLGHGAWSAVNANILRRRLLGLPPDSDVSRGQTEADDRGSGHPMRRFAEFGILPGYEFPSEPATLRLLRDRHEEEPITVVRRFGLAQYQPGAPAHARGHCWRVAGLDMASPWNPKTDDPQWPYVVCGGCELRFGATEHVACPRCGKARTAGQAIPGWEFGGFLAVRDDTPIAEDEDRWALASRLQCHPQWNGDVAARFALPTGWIEEVRREEDVRWVNEADPPTPAERESGVATLHYDRRGFDLCPACGRILKAQAPENPKASKARKEPRRGGKDDSFGHAQGCKNVGQPPRPLAITANTRAGTLRFIVDMPQGMEQDVYERWGLSLGFSLRSGMRLLYMLDGPEVDFVLEPLWNVDRDGRKWKRGALTFIDAAVGGSGFLDHAALEMNLVAARSLEHLDHEGCDAACYRCLKSYQNQRHHGRLSWPHAIEHLEALAMAAPESLASKPGDIVDPTPWLQAYEAGVGSPLELKFLRLFEKHGLHVEKQVPIAAKEGEKPISLADFAIPERRIAIYVDGACFHTGMNLRRDRRIRERLRAGEPPWRVVELKANDLGKGAGLIREIKS